MPIDKDGVMIILSSPSGAGKTTLVNLLSKLNNFEISISHTTRKPRPNEIKNKEALANPRVLDQYENSKELNY